ncbi:hypothetical protein [Aurantimicrobium sp. MWH-Uga1]|uniref:hypothetical protein n=1 Tax=Aurantimicrobium sp. MWH-Uga1 TaxID=2079575 RepID=UPI000DF0671F|nr:hypothetical protein [Aurantimicrobium sp. MWH-Uga1]AXE53948.1 hypothetical protein AURUGA1_00236 [Aurantimicrobium sp. MWH-Uga1]
MWRKSFVRLSSQLNVPRTLLKEAFGDEWGLEQIPQNEVIELAFHPKQYLRRIPQGFDVLIEVNANPVMLPKDHYLSVGVPKGVWVTQTHLDFEPEKWFYEIPLLAVPQNLNLVRHAVTEAAWFSSRRMVKCKFFVRKILSPRK